MPAGQGCCGALHVHAGDLNGGRALARHNIDAFERDSADLDAIIVNAAGCGAALKEYGHLLHDDPVYAERAAAFSARVQGHHRVPGAASPLNPALGALDVTGHLPGAVPSRACPAHQPAATARRPDAIPGVRAGRDAASRRSAAAAPASTTSRSRPCRAALAAQDRARAGHRRRCRRVGQSRLHDAGAGRPEEGRLTACASATSSISSTTPTRPVDRRARRNGRNRRRSRNGNARLMNPSLLSNAAVACPVTAPRTFFRTMSVVTTKECPRRVQSP